MRVLVAENPQDDLLISMWLAEACEILGVSDLEVVRPEDGPGTLSAALYRLGQVEPAASWSAGGVPTAAVEVRDDTRDAVRRGLGPDLPDGVDHLVVSRASGSEVIARWLERQQVGGLSQHEREMVETIVGAIAQLLASPPRETNPEDVAQAQAAMDTLNAQLRAPRPSRPIVRWTIGQLPAFITGALAGMTGNYLTMLTLSLGR